MAVITRERSREIGDAKVIGLISDTHIPARSKKIPERVIELFKDVDLILHAGDLVDMEVIRELEAIAPVVAVYGNMDPVSVRSNLLEIDSVKCLNWSIGLIHNPGTLIGLHGAMRIARENGFNVLIFGHTHRPCIEWRENVLFVNPGSPTIPLPPIVVKPTIGKLILTRDKIEPSIIKI
ncbi:MAG: metallophosphoesterase family protein [Methanocellales archaeon]